MVAKYLPVFSDFMDVTHIYCPVVKIMAPSRFGKAFRTFKLSIYNAVLRTNLIFHPQIGST